jgi:hypothetical protein
VERGGWKIEPTGPIARTSRSSRGKAEGDAAGVGLIGSRIAQAAIRTGAGAVEEIGVAGCPEHMAPVQGLGRSAGRGASIGDASPSSRSSEGPGWA